jgi:hypothetical protein
MRILIPNEVLEKYKVLFLSVPAIEEWHLTRIDLAQLPRFSLLNHAIRPDYFPPLSFHEHEESGLMVVDKVNNHSLYSLMILQSGKTPKKGFQELTPYEMNTLFNLYVRFIEWYKGSHFGDMLPRFSYNHDPDTTQRAGLQSIDRFHAHLYLLNKKELINGPLRREASLKELVHDMNYKDYFDPAAYCFERILMDLHKKWIKPPFEIELIEEPLIQKIINGRGLGLNLLYRGEVSYFKSAAFINYFRSLHRLAQCAFAQIMNSFATLPRWLSEETKTDLSALLVRLREVSPSVASFLRKKPGFAKNLLAYRSLCYSFSIDLLSPNEYLLNFYPRLFSEIGGAGIFASAGYNAVVIDRNKNSYFTPQAVEKRRTFQRELSNRFKSEPL